MGIASTSAARRGPFAAILLVSAVCGCGEHPPARGGLAEESRPPVSASVPTASTGSPTPPERPAPLVSEEDALACKRAHCWSEGKHCFDTCYKYNHPFNPEGHDACNAGCRHDYETDTCEWLCEHDPIAFRARSASAPARCNEGLARCRKDCDGHRVACERFCLDQHHACARRGP